MICDHDKIVNVAFVCNIMHLLFLIIFHIFLCVMLMHISFFKDIFLLTTTSLQNFHSKFKCICIIYKYNNEGLSCLSLYVCCVSSTGRDGRGLCQHRQLQHRERRGAQEEIVRTRPVAEDSVKVVNQRRTRSSTTHECMMIFFFFSPPVFSKCATGDSRTSSSPLTMSAT